MLREFFENEDGRLSIMRVISLILIVSGIVYLYLTEDTTGTAVLVGFGVGGKGAQSITERRNNK